MKPMGGTELQMAYLQKYVDKKLLDKVQITTSVPGKYLYQKTNQTILWQKILGINLTYIHGSKTKSLIIINMIGMFSIVIGTTNILQKMFDLPTIKCVVIKNGIDNIPARKKPFHPKRQV